MIIQPVLKRADVRDAEDEKRRHAIPIQREHALLLHHDLYERIRHHTLGHRRKHRRHEGSLDDGARVRRRRARPIVLSHFFVHQRPETTHPRVSQRQHRIHHVTLPSLPRLARRRRVHRSLPQPHRLKRSRLPQLRLKLRVRQHVQPRPTGVSQRRHRHRFSSRASPSTNRRPRAFRRSSRRARRLRSRARARHERARDLVSRLSRLKHLQPRRPRVPQRVHSRHARRRVFPRLPRVPSGLGVRRSRRSLAPGVPPDARPVVARSRGGRLSTRARGKSRVKKRARRRVGRRRRQTSESVARAARERRHGECLPRARLSRAASSARAEVKRHARTSKRNGCHHSRARARPVRVDGCRARARFDAEGPLEIYILLGHTVHTYTRKSISKYGAKSGRLARIRARTVAPHSTAPRPRRRLSTPRATRICATRTSHGSPFDFRRAIRVDDDRTRGIGSGRGLRLIDISRSVVPRAR